MNSINFPKMFSGNTTKVNNEERSNESILEWLHLLLSSENNTLFGDPEFGLRLRRYTFDQNNYILRDILIDEIYTQITRFCPEVYLNRNNISIRADGMKLYATITCKNQRTFENNMFELMLYRNEEAE